MHSKINHPDRRRFLLASATFGATLTLPGWLTSSLAQDQLADRDLTRDKRPIFHDPRTGFGSYDPYGDFREQKQVVTEHLFLPWEDIDLASLPGADTYALERGRKVLVTVEPWSWALDWNVTSDSLRSGVLAGSYDANMRAILEILQTFKSPLIIRWGHEMEATTGRFTWSLWPPEDYIRAYRRMIDMTRDYLPNAIIMWSPKGEEGLEQYYPGDDYCDIVGLSIFAYEPYDLYAYKRPYTFTETVEGPYQRVVGFGKPIWIAEYGYDGSLEYIENYVQETTLPHAEFPALEEIIYFNDKEIWPWPHNLGLPDWRVVRGQTNYPVRRK